MLIPVRRGIEYLPHQEAGIRWMMAREWSPDRTSTDPLSALENRVFRMEGQCRGGILADDMGLGKTFQTIGLLKNSPYKLRTLILCPPALLSGWTQELNACGIPCSSDLKTAEVCLASYNKAHLHAAAFRAAGFQRIILDEGHVIRNGESTKRWRSWMGISQKATSRWILSATPVQNGIKDWRNLCTWLRIKDKGIDVMTLGSIIMLRRTMEDLRSTMSESLPPAPVFIRHGLAITDEPEAKIFRALTDQLGNVMESRHVSALLKLELYMRVQQFLVHPQIYIESMRAKFGGAYPRPDWTGSATKFSAVSAELAASTEPTIIFCNFRAEMDRIAAVARSMGRRVWSVRGGMGAEAVGDAVAEAKMAALNREDVVVIVQIVAGGAGINLQFCTRILFLSQHWNPAVVHQAVGRAVRIGQRCPVKVHFFVIDDEVADNIDRRMAELHDAKIAAACSICSSLYAGSVWTTNTKT